MGNKKGSSVPGHVYNKDFIVERYFIIDNLFLSAKNTFKQTINSMN